MSGDEGSASASGDEGNVVSVKEVAQIKVGKIVWYIPGCEFSVPRMLFFVPALFFSQKVFFCSRAVFCSRGCFLFPAAAVFCSRRMLFSVPGYC